MRDVRGRFLSGPDSDRHVLTRAERRKGYLIATRFSAMPNRVRCWLRRKITRFYTYVG